MWVKCNCADRCCIYWKSDSDGRSFTGGWRPLILCMWLLALCCAAVRVPVEISMSIVHCAGPDGCLATGFCVFMLWSFSPVECVKPMNISWMKTPLRTLAVHLLYATSAHQPSHFIQTLQVGVWLTSRVEGNLTLTFTHVTETFSQSDLNCIPVTHFIRGP